MTFKSDHPNNIWKHFEDLFQTRSWPLVLEEIERLLKNSVKVQDLARSARTMADLHRTKTRDAAAVKTAMGYLAVSILSWNSLKRSVNAVSDFELLKSIPESASLVNLIESRFFEARRVTPPPSQDFMVWGGSLMRKISLPRLRPCPNLSSLRASNLSHCTSF